MAKRKTHARAATIAALSTLTALAAGSARADIITVNDIVNGLNINRQQCSQLEYSVWVTAHNRSFCIRYYVSVKGGVEGRPVVFMQGDYNLKPDRRTGRVDPSSLRDVDTANLQRMADAFSADAKTPAIYLARPGMDLSLIHI